MASLYRRAAWAVAAPTLIWTTFMMLAISPYIQRHILYAHKVYQWWQDTNQPQHWGFARNQVTSFYLDTEDGEKIHAWHVLPLPVYRQHEAVLQQQPTGFCRDVSSSQSLRILKEDPTAKLIVYLHGNAGHLPSVMRAPSFHMYTATSNYHVLAIDYRGFGLSTGSPTEDGLVLDASAALRFALDTAGLSPDRILILGHSLGTAVAAGAAERFARVHGIDFAGVLLVAGFSSLPNMLSGYSIGGWVPILRPIRSWPRVLHFVLGFIVDHWETAKRLRSMVSIVHNSNLSDSKSQSSDNDGAPRRHLRLSLIHAADDRDIPCLEDDKILAAAVRPLLPREDGREISTAELQALKDVHTTYVGDNAFVSEWRDGGVTIRQERFPHGGHNNMVIYAPVLLEIMRAFDEASP